jgi:hypothetical protein
VHVSRGRWTAASRTAPSAALVRDLRKRLPVLRYAVPTCACRHLYDPTLLLSTVHISFVFGANFGCLWPWSSKFSPAAPQGDFTVVHDFATLYLTDSSAGRPRATTPSRAPARQRPPCRHSTHEIACKSAAPPGARAAARSTAADPRGRCPGPIRIEILQQAHVRGIKEGINTPRARTEVAPSLMPQRRRGRRRRRRGSARASEHEIA